MSKFYSVFGTNYQQYFPLQLPLCFTRLKTTSFHMKREAKNQLFGTILNTYGMSIKTSCCEVCRWPIAADHFD